jgi:hypothetical protein
LRDAAASLARSFTVNLSTLINFMLGPLGFRQVMKIGNKRKILLRVQANRLLFLATIGGTSPLACDCIRPSGQHVTAYAQCTQY